MYSIAPAVLTTVAQIITLLFTAIVVAQFFSGPGHRVWFDLFGYPSHLAAVSITACQVSAKIGSKAVFAVLAE
jgi:hypothetical protein